MKYSQRYEEEMVDEWKRCYLNYPHLNKLCGLLKECVREALHLTDMLKYGILIEEKAEKDILRYENVKLDESEIEDVILYEKHFKRIADEINFMFVESYHKNIEIFEQFTQYKYTEIETNFHMCWVFHYLAKESVNHLHKNFISYLQYLFVETIFLTKMIRSNIEAERRILTKHKFYASKVYETPKKKIDRYLNIDKCYGLQKEIERYYIQVNEKTIKHSRNQLNLLAKQSQFSHYESLFIGILLGTIATIIIFMSIILARAHIALEVDPFFNHFFPLWRGISFYIVYAWMMGINVFYFENYFISHKIIMETKYTETPRSTDLFKIASFFSVLFIVCFIIFALVITDIIDTGALKVQYLPLIVWAIFILFLVNPFPRFYFNGRIYVFKMLFKVLLSIIQPTPADFLAVFSTVQLFALINAVQDTVYTVCYYCNLQFPLSNKEVIKIKGCVTSSSQGKFAFTVLLYGIRIIHCLKTIWAGRNEKPFYQFLDFYNIIKYCFGMSTAILSYMWQSSINSTVFPAWIVFALITAVYSWIWDMRVTFDVLNLNSKNFLLRDEITYPKINYYLWIVATLLLRLTWVLYISPNISKNLLGSPEIFILVFGYLQIVRRGIWNTVRIEMEQLKNRRNLTAVPKQKAKIEKELYEFVNQSKERLEMVTLQDFVEPQEIFIEYSKESMDKNQTEVKKLTERSKEIFEEQQTQNLIRIEYGKVNKNIISKLFKDFY